MPQTPQAQLRRTRLILLALWFILYGSFTLLTPPLLDDADSVHAEVAREMLLRHDWTTLYANGIRYLEKAPLFYWSMAGSFRLFGIGTAAARLPLALSVLALAFAVELFGRRAFSPRAGLLAGTLTLLSPGIFLFTRILIPDALLCLWITVALLCYLLQLQRPSPSPLLSGAFAAACALNLLTKGLIGVLFPLAIVLFHLLLLDGFRPTLSSLRRLHPLSSTLVFLAIAAPWHILAGEANPTQGHPGTLTRVAGHWLVPFPTLGNVHGWWWFYFINEHLLRYLNLRVPRDYDTVPLTLFFALLLLWLAPFSAFLPAALARIPLRRALHSRLRPHQGSRPLSPRDSTLLLLGLWAAIPMLFFSFSTRQEYYCLPALPALFLLLAASLDEEATEADALTVPAPRLRAGQRASVVILILGSIAALVAAFFALNSTPPGPGFDLANLLKQNPADYALSLGHFLDLTGPAMGAFHTLLILTAVSLLLGSLGAWWARRDYHPMLSNAWLAAGALGFLLAAHLGLQIFAPVLSSQPLAAALTPILQPSDILVINGEYESASTLAFYLHRDRIHILNGRSSNLWYGSFFTDAPPLFETDTTLPVLWTNRRRVFLWTEPDHVPALPTPAFLIARIGGKEILSNQSTP